MVGDSPLTTPRYATVVLERSQANVGRELTYAVPEEMAALQPGFAVLVPVGRQLATGYVIALSSDPGIDPALVRPLRQFMSKSPVFDATALRVARWLSSYYHCTLSEAIALFVPHGWQQASEYLYSIRTATANAPAGVPAPSVRGEKARAVLTLLAASPVPLSRRVIERKLRLKDARTLLARLVQEGLVQEAEALQAPEVRPKKLLSVRVASLVTEAPSMPRAPRQEEALRRLLERGEEGISTAELAGQAVTLATLRSLEKKGLVEFFHQQVDRLPHVHEIVPEHRRVQLTDEQQAAVAGVVQALDEAASGQPATLLLQGVTASGKTEVYLSAIEECLRRGRRALVLVPEIALTAQTVEIFRRRFHERVGILHSALTAGERFDEWRRVRSGRADIVVGARSAVFAPCGNLGLIIIDEEHDHSYKQDTAVPRYHARDVAARRAALDGAVLLLGSATPSLESYLRATRGDYRHLFMHRRIGTRTLPRVEIVDMTQEARAGELPVISQRLREELLATVQGGHQAILFLNRRGYATYVQCLGCGHVEKCPHCDVSLTFHRSAAQLRCHHCGHAAAAPELCPSCGGWMIGFTGTGTEKVEREVETMLAESGLGDVRILRLDRDTTTQKGAHGKILGEFRQGKAQVLIGTQMVTKGLDFPRVTLVGVIAADSALNVPDFRAAERTFQLLAQVAGRAGRGEHPGLVLVQTLAGDHYAITAARDADYNAFVQTEMELRQNPPYPPYASLANIISWSEDWKAANDRINEVALWIGRAIEAEGGATEMLGPVECPLGRIKGRHRLHILVRDRNRPRLHRVLAVLDQLPRDIHQGLQIDIDPSSIL